MTEGLGECPKVFNTLMCERDLDWVFGDVFHQTHQTSDSSMEDTLYDRVAGLGSTLGVVLLLILFSGLVYYNVF